LTVKLRYKAPDGDTSRLLEFPLTDQNATFADASGDFKFAAAVAGFGMVLRDSPHKGAATLAEVLHWAEQGTGSDAGGYRGEFISLVKQAGTILPSQG
jgi:Ca-activated chloride channel family protein